MPLTLNRRGIPLNRFLIGWKQSSIVATSGRWPAFGDDRRRITPVAAPARAGLLGASDKMCRCLKGIGDEKFDHSAEMGQGVSLVEDFLLDVIENFIVPLAVALPELKIIGHKRIKFFAPVAGKRLQV